MSSLQEVVDFFDNQFSMRDATAISRDQWQTIKPVIVNKLPYEVQEKMLLSEIRAIAGRCSVPEKSFRHYYISIADYKRLLELSSV